MEYLSTVDSVNLISPFTNPVPLNNFASGFSQDNHASLSTYSDGTPFLPRYFDSYGINGKGQNIAMMDSTPDHYHAFLYDSNKPQIEFNKIMTDHRKIAYFYNKYGDDEDYMIKVTQENAGHGPHVCGIALGVSEDPNSAINAYRGVATGSKLFYAGNFLSGTSTFIDDPDGLSNLIKLFKETNTRIFTNSWGGESMTSKHLEFEQMSRDLSDSLLVLFAAGNSGTNNKYYTVMYPASCKNILTIGSLRMLYNMTDVTFHLILSENETIHNIKGDAILYTKVITKEAYATLSIYDDYSHPNTTAKIILVNKDTLKNFLSPLKISNQKIDYEVLALLVDNYTQPIVTTADKMNLMDLIDFIKLDTFVIQDHNITNYIDKRIKLISNFTSIYSPIYKKSDSSSIGPTVTGLIKPDIVTPGQNIWSSSSMNVKQPNHGIDGNPSKNFSDLVKLSGTSMATPNAAGCAALIAHEKFDLQFENSKMNNDQITIGKLEFNDFSSTSLHYIKEIASDSVSINDKSTSIRDISIADDSVMFSTSNSIKIEYPLTKISIVTLKSENEFELKSAANADALNLFVEYNEVKRKLTLNSSNIVLSSKGIKNIQINEMEVINSKFNVGENVKIDVQKLKLSAISSFNDINGKIDIDNIEINENGNYNVISENVSIKTNDKEISIQNFSYITTDLNKFKELNFNVQFGNMKISDSTASSEKFDLQFENSKMNNDQITIGKLEFNDFSSTSLHYIKEIASDSVSINDKSAAIDGISVSGDSILFNASSAIKFECPSSKVRSVAFLSGIGKQRAFSITVPDANVTVPKMSISFTNADGALVKCYGISTVEELNSLFQIDFANANNSEIQFGQSEPAPGGKWGLKTILCVAIPCAAAAIVAVVVVVVLVMKRRRSKGADERSMQTETLSLNLV
ncbi:Clan SB, family S8, subtilisin-like serine peptidase [Histomonas meleagridis]|uniref:Clan SB, family S8, subtilisin-like serine peptidase n=1 Tax=Histomonas meleagridis TaxID=135588 RepID=UPI00355ABD0C|nr:Clan SB, family S8, subtilisin-like serine peptidase [Histomonas meleagridis]KAH0801591.1 Clan SB, family S8, subtilisin-like serine peptidase [Histomonas meleagridis]